MDGHLREPGAISLIENKKRDFPCIVVSPQSPGRGWNVDVLAALLDEIASTYRVDKDRIYLTGLAVCPEAGRSEVSGVLWSRP